MKTFGQILDSAHEVSLEDQESLVSILQHRLVDQRRAVLARTVKEAREEFKKGRLRPASPAEIVKKVLA